MGWIHSATPRSRPGLRCAFPTVLLLPLLALSLTAASAPQRAAALQVPLPVWKIVWTRADNGLSVWTSKHRRVLDLTPKKRGIGDQGVWSPDGNYLALVRWNNGVYVVKAGETRRRLVFRTDREVELAWSPDSRKLALAILCDARLAESNGGLHWICREGPEGVLALYTIWRDGSHRRKLVSIRSSADEPKIGSVAWSPDGSRIAYAVSGGGEFLYTISAAGGVPHLLRRERDHLLGAPAWSPDSRRIAYGAHCDDQHGELFCDLVVQNSFGGKPRVLLPSPGDSAVLPPAWLPDGRTLLYSQSGNAGRRILAISVATAHRRVVLREFAVALALAADGRTFAFLEQQLGTRPRVASLSGRILDRGPLVAEQYGASLWIR